jgi:predicted GNAT family acetyltransferase
MDSEDEDLTFAQLAKKIGPKKKKEKAAPEPKDKSETISKLYYDEESGYQSKARTYQMAHARDARITRKDVEDWFRENGVAQKPRSFKNSYVAKYQRQEYQMDLFQMNKGSGIKDAEEDVHAHGRHLHQIHRHHPHRGEGRP